MHVPRGLCVLVLALFGTLVMTGGSWLGPWRRVCFCCVCCRGTSLASPVGCCSHQSIMRSSA